LTLEFAFIYNIVEIKHSHNLRAMHSVTAHPVWNNPGFSSGDAGFFCCPVFGTGGDSPQLRFAHWTNPHSI